MGTWLPSNSSRETHENILHASSAYCNFHGHLHISRSGTACCWSSAQLSTIGRTGQSPLWIYQRSVLSSWRSGLITKTFLSSSQENIRCVAHNLKTCLSDQTMIWTRPKSHRCHHPTEPYRSGYFWTELSWAWVNASRMPYMGLMFQLTVQKLKQILFVPYQAESKSRAFSLASVTRKEVGNGWRKFS